MIYATRYQAPFGALTLFASDKGLIAVVFNDPSDSDVGIVTKECAMNPQAYPSGKVEYDDSRFTEVISELNSYFTGSLRTFTSPIDYADKGTEFQRRIWDALREIPYGTVETYGQLAERIGNPKAARAVGLANNRNPLAIVVPCHRVIGANGRLVGYAGGLSFKQSLLELEGVTLKNEGGGTSRDAILRAGTIAFSKSGYKGTTIDDIAELAGVNRRMIYHHFGSKNGLYDAVVTAVNDPSIEAGVDSADDGPNVAMRLKLYQLLETGSTTDTTLEADIERNLERVTKLQSEGKMDTRYDKALVARLITIADRWKTANEKPRTRIDPVVSRLKNTQ